MVRSTVFTATVIFCVGAVAASASTLQFSGTAYGKFKNLANADGDVLVDEYVTFDGENWVSNGPKTAVVWGHGPSTAGYWDTSFIGIRSFDFSCDLTSGNQTCDIGRLDWFNASPGPAPHDEDFDVRAVVSFDLLSPIVTIAEREGFEMNIRSAEGDESLTSDFVFATAWNDYNIEELDLGNGYAITGFSFRSEGAGETWSLSDTEFVWRNEEDSVSSLYIVAEIEGLPSVPLPAAGWMLLAGLGGLAAMRRRTGDKSRI